MADPSLELQGAIVARLKSVGAVTALIGTRVYDKVPTAPNFPYITLGPDDLLSDNADCITGYEFTVQIDAWSRASGFPEVKRIANEIRLALHDYDFTLASNALVNFEHDLTRYLDDPDGLTLHAALRFRGYVEQP